ncbi:unknown protein [Seminavis robusta]|uniref:Transmembrane protein n=1 Tax=Seminavis robusta TaxID=568900 RepID=A0A9N8DF57_9STRA|nr:unknown protein [Seminavis robusta]|eukprot:Sro40_g024880.1 n/a (312) ;mRNA; r:124107-125042
MDSVYNEMRVEAAQTINHEIAAGSQTLAAPEMTALSMKALTSVSMTVMSVIAVGIAIAATVVLTRNPAPSPPVYADSRPLCNASTHDDNETKMGITQLVVGDVNSDVLLTKKRELEDAFLEIYNDQTGGCDDSYERFMLKSELVQAETITTEEKSWTVTWWKSTISCNGCSDVAPLFGVPTDGTLRSVELESFEAQFLQTVADTVDAKLAAHSPSDPLIVPALELDANSNRTSGNHPLSTIPSTVWTNQTQGTAPADNRATEPPNPHKYTAAFASGGGTSVIVSTPAPITLAPSRSEQLGDSPKQNGQVLM